MNSSCISMLHLYILLVLLTLMSCMIRCGIKILRGSFKHLKASTVEVLVEVIQMF